MRPHSEPILSLWWNTQMLEQNGYSLSIPGPGSLDKLHVCVYTCMFIYVFIYICIYIHIYIYVCVCISLYIHYTDVYIYIYMNTYRESSFVSLKVPVQRFLMLFPLLFRTPTLPHPSAPLPH